MDRRMRSNKSRRRRKKEIYLVPFFSRSAFAIFIFVYNERRRHPLIAATTMLSTDIGNRAVFAAERDFYRTTSSCFFFFFFFFCCVNFFVFRKIIVHASPDKRGHTRFRRAAQCSLAMVFLSPPRTGRSERFDFDRTPAVAARYCGIRSVFYSHTNTWTIRYT